MTLEACAAIPLVVSSQPTIPPQEQRRGVEHADVIDLIMHDAETDEAVLIMVETRPWEGDPAQLLQLQEKCNAYLAFALDGEMRDSYPALSQKPLRVQLESTFMPDPQALEFLQHVHDQIAFQGVKLEVRVKEESGGGGCGPQCGCAGRQ